MASGRVVQKLRGFNLFADPETAREGNEQVLNAQVMSTFVYLVLLVTSLFALVLSIALVQITVSVTVAKPSLATYEKLQMDYPNTLSCPCQQVAVQYADFLSTVPSFHQICSSELMSPTWIASLFEPEMTRLTPLDFRLTAAAQFRLLALICYLSKTVVEQARDQSIAQQLVSPTVLSGASFDAQSDAVINRVVARLETVVKPSHGTQLTMIVLVQSRIHSAVNTDAFTSGVPGSDQYSTVPSFYPLHDNASSSKNLQQDFGFCNSFNSVTYKAGIYAWSTDMRSLVDMMTPYPPPVFEITGMSVGCTPYDALMNGTLECFYDPTCLNATAKWISTLSDVDLPKPLNGSMASRFLSNDSISSIFQQQMIEQWITEKNFSKYYSICAPLQCTYTFTAYNNFLYIITMIISLFGGLSAVLRIMSPLVVHAGQCIHMRFIKRSQSEFQPQRTQQPDRRARVAQTFSLARMKLISLNLFKGDLNDEALGVRATRVHILLLVVSVTILALYSSVAISIRSITVSKPSLITFEQLYAAHSLTLKCPCSRIAVPREKIITMWPPRFHQVCSSQFLQPVWLDGFFQVKFANESMMQSIQEQDFRIQGFSMFYSISTLCQWANDAIANAQAVFIKDVFITANALSRDKYQTRMSALILTFQQSTAGNIAALVVLMRISLAASGTQSGISYQSTLINGWRLIRRYSPAPVALTDCACSIAFDCPKAGGSFICSRGENCTAGTTVWSTPGFSISCIELDSRLNSDLRCFYNQTCYNILLSMYNVDMPTRLPLPAPTLAIPVLNSSAPSRFLPTDTLGTLFNQLMVEEWDIESSFENYYEICAPVACTYTFSERLDLFYVITTITGVIGGLLVTFRLLVPATARLIRSMMVKWRSRHVDNGHNELVGIKGRKVTVDSPVNQCIGNFILHHYRITQLGNVVSE